MRWAPALILLSGCLLFSDAPPRKNHTGLGGGDAQPACVDASCPGGYTCDFRECGTDCVVASDCQQGYRCCLASNDCPHTDTRFFECIQGGW